MSARSHAGWAAGSAAPRPWAGRLALAAVLAAAACSSTRPCRQGSILLTVNLDAAALTARALEIDVTLAGEARPPLVWTPSGGAFARSESLEIDLPQYQAGETVAITALALTGVGGTELARGVVTSMPAPPGCLSVSVMLMAPAGSGGAGGTAARGGAGGESSTGGAAAAGRGGQAGAGTGGAGAVGGSMGTAGGGARGTGGNVGTGGATGGVLGSAGSAASGGSAGRGASGGTAGSAGRTGSGGAGASDGDPCAAMGSGAVAVLGCPCSAAGTLACNGNAQAVTLICSAGAWTLNQTCMAGNLCDSRTGVSKGTCQPIAPACQSANPGQVVCDTATSVGQCGTDLVTVAMMRACSGNTPACLNGACVACKPTTIEACGVCGDGTATCDGTGTWGACVGGSAQNTYYRDADVDGFGNPAMSMTVCGAAPTGYVSNSKDCCDADANAHPGQTAFFTTADACAASQTPDGFDYDCDGKDTTESSVLNASCVSTLSTTGCGPCPMCYCNSTNGGPPVCGSTACLTYSSAVCGASRYFSAMGFDGNCGPNGGGNSAGTQGCR